MKNGFVRIWTMACILAVSGVAQAQVQGYWVDASGRPLLDGRGQCIRSGAWPAATPQAGCDPMPEPVVVAPAAAPQDQVILLPDADGKVGALLVQSQQGQQLIDKSYAAVSVALDGKLTLGLESAESVRQRFGALLQAQPSRPQSFIVRFAPGSSTKLTADAAAVFDQIKSLVQSRIAPEVEVIGHTDSVGRPEANDALSVKRAETVKGSLVAAGIAAQIIEVSGRGEREPLVPTADEVPEAQNRRVEITVR